MLFGLEGVGPFGNVAGGIDRGHAGDFVHEDDLDAGGDVGFGEHAAFAGPRHLEVDRPFLETEEFDVPAVTLQKGADLVEDVFDLVKDGITHGAYSIADTKTRKRYGKPLV